jgi:hypothetical protein
MADRISLTNDAVDPSGFSYVEEVFTWNVASETSVMAASATLLPIAAMKANGRIVNAFIGLVTPPVSASGFVSGTVDATFRINSAEVLSTLPSIPMAGSAGAATRKSTNAGGGVSAVVNTASASFSAGDQISFDYNARSVGSAAAGATSKGLYATVVVRYAAR